MLRAKSKAVEIPIWLIELVEKIDNITEKVKQSTFDRYRECGQLIIKAGWLKGKWNPELREYLSEKTGYSLATIRNMVRLGRASEEQYQIIVKQFPSLHAWTHPSGILEKSMEPKYKSILLQKEIPVTRFKNEEEAKHFFKMFDGEYLGCFYHGTVNREMVERRDGFLTKDHRSKDKEEVKI